LLATSDAIKAAWLHHSRQLSIKVKINNVTYGSEEITSLSFDSGSISGEVFQIGSTYMNSVQIVFPSIIESIAEDIEVIPKLGVMVNGSYEYTKLGHFFIDDFDRNKNNQTTSITATDKMRFMEGEYVSKLTYPKAYREVALDVANSAGVEVNANSFASLGIGAINQPEGYTHRQAIGLIAQFEGGFASFNRNGELEIRRLAPTTFEITPESYLLKGFTKNEASYRIGGISVKTGEEETDVIRVGSTNGSQVELENKIMTQTLLNQMWELVKTLNYFPYELKWRGCPPLEAGDWIYISDKDGNKYSVPNLSYSITFNGGMSAESKALTSSTSQATYKYKGSLNQRIDYLDSVLSANKWNTNYYGSETPENPKEGDIWFKPNGQDTEIWVYKNIDGVLKWVMEISSAVDPDLLQAIEDAKKAGQDAQLAAEEAKTAADDAKEVGEEAKQAGEAARLVANEAKTIAADAKQAGEEAQKVGEDAKSAAEYAKSAADDAKVVGENAKLAANDAKQAGENAAILAGQAQETADDVNQRIGDVVIDIGDIQGDINAIAADVGDVQTDIGKIITDATATASKANDAFNKASAVEGRTSTLETSVGSIKSTMTDIEMDLDSTTKKINEVSVTVDGQKSEIASVKTTATSALSKATVLESTVDGVKLNLSSIEQTLEDSRLYTAWSNDPNGKGMIRVYPNENLINLSTITLGKFVYWPGTDLTSNVSRAVTDYIPVKEGEQYTLSLSANDGFAFSFYLYKDNTSGISDLRYSGSAWQTPDTNGTTFGTPRTTLAIPTGYKYARVSFIKSSGTATAEVMNSIQPKMELGAVQTPYTVSPLDDPIKAEMAYVGYSSKDSNNPTDYVWSTNSKMVMQKALSVETDVDGIKTTIISVESTANSALSKANVAQTTADGNISKIASVETTANSALSKANTAQSTADGNTTKITAAQTTANSALTKANTVEQTVDGQKTTIASIQTNLDNNITKVNQITETVDGHTQLIASTTTTANSALTKANSVSSTVDGLTIKVSSVESTANAANTKALQVEATASSLTTTIQNISIAGSNMVTNGGFENDFVGWNSGTRHSIDNTESHTGSKSLKISSGSGITTVTPKVNTFPVIPGRKYEVSFWYKTSADANGDSYNQKLRLANSSGSLLHALVWTGAQTEWAMKSAIFTAGSNIYEWQFSISASHTIGTVWWDDISIVDVTDRESATTQFTQLSTDINLKVSKGDVINQINVGTESILIAGNKLNITAQTTIDNAVIKTANIVDLAVSTAKISDLAVNEGKIGNLAVTNAKIANLSVTEGKIGDAAITNAKIGNLAVSEGKIANLAVTNAKIASLAVTEGKIGDAAITTAKIGNLAVSEAKIASLAVSEGKIANLAVTETKIGDAAITNAKIGNLAVSTAKIADGAIVNAKIGDAAITNAKIADASISSAKIISLDADKITTSSLSAITTNTGNLNISGTLTVTTENNGLTGSYDYGDVYGEAINPRYFVGTWSLRNRLLSYSSAVYSLTSASTKGSLQYYASSLIGPDYFKFRSHANSDYTGLRSRLDMTSEYISMGTSFTDDRIKIYYDGGMALHNVHVGEINVATSRGYSALRLNVTGNNSCITLFPQESEQGVVINGEGHSGNASMWFGRTSGKPRIWSTDLYNYTGSGSANLAINENGTLFRATSARKYKEDIQVANKIITDAKKILGINPASWFDKLEMNLGQVKGRYYGFIADEFHEKGLTEVVIYGDKGQVEGLAYDRLTMYQNVILNEHEQEIQKLKIEVSNLKTKVEELEAA